MNDSDGSHSCWSPTQELTQDQPDDPGPQCLIRAAGEVTVLRSLRA